MVLATLENIDDYYASTAFALRSFGGAREVSVELQVDSSEEKPNMLTTIKAYIDNADISLLKGPLESRMAQVQKYVPGYQLEIQPEFKGNYIELAIRVTGSGDYLPAHAGNLDIINCAAIAVAEDYAERKIAIANATKSPSNGYLPHWLKNMIGNNATEREVRYR